MKRKFLTFLLALGCIFSLGVATACSGGGTQLPNFSDGKQSILEESSEEIVEGNSESNSEEGDISEELPHEHAFVYSFEKSTTEGYYTLIKACESCEDVERKEVPDSDCQIDCIEPTCTEEGKISCVYQEVYKWEGVIPALGHDFITKYDTQEEESLCEDGGGAIVYCAECNFVDQTIIIEPLGHHSSTWQIVTVPTLASTGMLQGVCNGCNLVVNDVLYMGCGQEVMMVIPQLNSYDYTITNINQPNCSEPGTATYEIMIDGQTFAFNADLSAKNHSIMTSDGVAEQLARGSIIYVDDERYMGSWRILADEIICCDRIAQGIFVCVDCGSLVAIQLGEKHTRPASEDIVLKPGDNLNPDVITYQCVRCAEIIHEEIPHEMEYRLLQESDGTFTLYIICENECNYNECIKGVDVTEEVVKYATCIETGIVQYTMNVNGEIITVQGVIPCIKHIANGYEFFAGQRIDIDTANAYGFMLIDNEVSVDCYGSTGVGECQRCGRMIGVSIYAPHIILDDGSYIPPTCEKDGEYKCAECGELVTVLALGHDLQYTIVSEDDEAYTIMEECKNRDCAYSVKVIIEKSCCTTYIESLSCVQDGTLIITVYTDESQTIVKYKYSVSIPKTRHTLTYKGTPTAIDVNEVYEYDADVMRIVDSGADIPCCDSEDSVLVIFTCEGCGNYCGIDVRMPHTKPTDPAQITTIAPTCIEKGYDEWNCEVCGEYCQDNFKEQLN